MTYSRPSNYPYPWKFKSVEDAENYAKRMYAALTDNDMASEFLRDRATDKDLKDLIVRPEWYGATGDGTHDDTTAIQAAATAATAAGRTLAWGNGATYRISSKLTLQCDCLDLGAKINVYGNPAIAIVVGYDSVTTPTDSLFGWRAAKRVELPDIENKAFVSLAGWVGYGTGVLIGNVFESYIYTKWICGFDKGIRCYAAAATATGAGVCHNHIFLGHLEDNKIALQLDYGSNGFANENNFYGGRLHIQGTEGSEIAGTRFLQIGTSTAFGPNNNCFYKPCLEGDGPEYHAEFYGNLNHIMFGRWEVTSVSPKIHFADSGANYSNGNVIFYGYGAEFAITNDPLSYNNTIYNREGIAIEASQTARATMTLANAAGSTYDSLRIVNSTERPWGDHSADYSVGLSARYIKMKQNADTNPRFQIDGDSGAVEMGDGTTAPPYSINYTEVKYLDGQDQYVQSDSDVSFNKAFLSSLTSGNIPYNSITEKLTDGGLENWTDGALDSWTAQVEGSSTVTQDAAVKHGGASSAKFTTVGSTNNGTRIYQSFTLTASTRYRMRFWYNNHLADQTVVWQMVDNTTPGSPNFYLNSNGTWQASATAVAAPSSVADTWTLYTFFFTTHQTYTAYRLYVGNTYGDNGDTDYNWVDDISLEEVTGFDDSPLTTDGTDVDNSGVYKVDGTQVVGAQVVDARLADTPNSGDATTDGLIDALRDLIIAHGLGASS